MEGTNLIKKGIAVAVILLFISVGIIPSTGNMVEKKSTVSIDGNTLYVGGSGPGNYTKIQDAIDNASDGDTVYVYSGTYYEKVVIDRSIELIGEDKTSTIINCGDIDDAVNIFADSVHLKGFTITGCDNYKWNGIFIFEVENINISENIISSEFDHVILIRESSDCTIINNIIKDNPSKAITIEDSSKFEVSSNSISDVRIGVWCYWSRDFIIKENIISSKGKDYSFGIAVGGDPHYLSNSEVNHNTVEGFEFGIELYGASGYVITNNDVKNNVYGILLQFANENNISGNNILNNENGIYSVTSGNRLYHNNFIGNSAIH